MTLNLDFKVMPIDAVSVLCAQLTRDLLAIAKFLFRVVVEGPKGWLRQRSFPVTSGIGAVDPQARVLSRISRQGVQARTRGSLPFPLPSLSLSSLVLSSPSLPYLRSRPLIFS